MKNMEIEENRYNQVEGTELEEMSRDIRRNNPLRKALIPMIAVPFIISALCVYFVILHGEGGEAIALGSSSFWLCIFLVLFFPGLAIIPAIGIKNDGLRELIMYKERSIKVGEQSMFYSYVSPDAYHQDKTLLTTQCEQEKIIDYKDIEEILYNPKSRLCKIQCKAYTWKITNYVDNETEKEIVKGKPVIICNLFSEGVFDMISQKSHVDIKEEGFFQLTHKVGFVAMGLLYLFLGLAVPMIMLICL